MVSLLERNPCWNIVAKFFWGSSEAPSLRNSIEIWFHCWKEILVEIWWITNFEAPSRLLWGSREATLNVLLFKIEWMNRRFGSAWGLPEIGRIPDMCHTSPSVAKFKLCKPEKKNSLLSNTLVPRLTSIRSQAGNLSTLNSAVSLSSLELFTSIALFCQPYLKAKLWRNLNCFYK